MSAGRMRALAAMLVLLVLFAASASAESYRFLGAGVGLDPLAGWTVLSPETVGEQTELLRSLGANADTLRADWAANGGVFTVFLPDGPQVELSVVETPDTAEWGDAEAMTEAESRAFLGGYTHAPFEDARFDEQNPGFLRVSWTLNAGGAPVGFARLVTVRQGALYALTASGAGLPADALHAANRAVLSALSFLGARAGGMGGDGRAAPQVIPDDGTQTPVRIANYTGVSLADTVDIDIETLPGTELRLLTATDSLRGVADESGRHRYTVSTRRDAVYAYTLVAKAEGRSESRVDLTVERRLTGDALAAAYRKSAVNFEKIDYQAVVSDPAKFAGQPVFFRGQVIALAERGGFPCALMYTSNPSRGNWKNPVWVVLTSQLEIAPGNVLTVYGDLRGDAPSFDEGGRTGDAPAVVLKAVSP